MAERSNRVANYLRACGVRSGDRVLVMLPNVVPLWEIMLAAIKLGAVISPATTLLSSADLQDRVERGEMRHVIADAPSAAKLAAVPGDYTRIVVEGGRATGVTYVNSAGEEFFQPAEMVILSAYVLQNVRLLLLSGIGKPYDPKSGEGVVGKNYAYQTMSSVNVFFDDKIINPFIGAGALATVIDDFNGDNFDHGGLGFIGGAYIAGMVTGGRPIEMIYTPQGTPAWGMEWKHAAAKNYLRSFSLSVHGSNMSSRGNYLDLDPTYRDVHGRPMLRMTFDFNGNDHKMSDYLTDRAAEVAKAMNPREIKLNRRTGSWSVTPYQTTHNTGGAIMGDNPKNSVVNKYLQSWDVPNVFSMGSGAFPQNAGYNPTGTVAALAYYSAANIISQYLKSPGPMVRS